VNIDPPWQFPVFGHLLEFFIARLFFSQGQESQATGVSMARKFSTTAKPIEHPTRIHATYERFLLERNVFATYPSFRVFLVLLSIVFLSLSDGWSICLSTFNPSEKKPL